MYVKFYFSNFALCIPANIAGGLHWVVKDVIIDSLEIMCEYLRCNVGISSVDIHQLLIADICFMSHKWVFSLCVCVCVCVCVCLWPFWRGRQRTQKISCQQILKDPLNILRLLVGVFRNQKLFLFVK